MAYYLTKKKKCTECHAALKEGKNKVSWLSVETQEPLERITDVLFCSSCQRLYLKSNKKKIEGTLYVVPTIEAEPTFSKVEDRDRRKASLGIYPSTFKSKKCATCEFHLKRVCAVHLIKTSADELCDQYKNHYKRIVYGGSFSSK